MQTWREKHQDEQWTLLILLYFTCHPVDRLHYTCLRLLKHVKAVGLFLLAVSSLKKVLTK